MAEAPEQQIEPASPKWCSWCFQHVPHTLLQSGLLSTSLFQCSQCRQPTSACKVPRCTNMTRSTGTSNDWYCAIHGGTINSFERFDATISDPTEFVEFLTERDGTNVRAIVGKIGLAAAGIAAVGPAAFVLAPAVGGLIGTAFLGLNGAAATSAGLAVLGGGSLAAGGLGMAGGAAAVAAAGSVGGGWLGYLMSSQLLSGVDGFRITKLADGRDPALVFIDGFLTEGHDSGALWLAGLRERYADRAAYYVHWESKTLSELGKSLAGLTTAQAAQQLGQTLVAQASKANAAAFGLVAHPLLAWTVARHPWFRAVLCAERTGLLVQQALMRCANRSFILFGHSLGARATVRALAAIGAMPESDKRSRIVAAHLLGGAEGVGPPEKWTFVASAVDEACISYYSRNDDVLKFAYPVGTLFDSEAIGRTPIAVPAALAAKVRSIDVSDFVGGHTKYKGSLRQFVT